MTKKTIFFIIAWIFCMAFLWGGFQPTTIENQFIPTVINGITTTTSILIGVIGLLLTLGFTNKIINFKNHKNYIWYTIFALYLTISLVVFTYVDMINNPFQEALKISITALFTAFIVFINITLFILDLLNKRK